MTTCKKFLIKFEIPEVTYNIKSPSICNLCKPQQSVRDCVSHVLDNHLQEIFQRTNCHDAIQNRICCIQEYERTSLKNFVFHFGKNHGPVGFKTSGNYCFLVTHTPILEPNFYGNDSLEQIVKPTLIFQTVPQDSFEEQCYSNVPRTFFSDYHGILNEQLGVLLRLKKAGNGYLKMGEMENNLNKMKEMGEQKCKDEEKIKSIHQQYLQELDKNHKKADLSASILESQINACMKMLHQCTYAWNTSQPMAAMKDIEKRTISFSNYTKCYKLVNQRLHDGKFSIVEKEENGNIHQYVKINKHEEDEDLELIFEIDNKIRCFAEKVLKM